MGSSNRPSDDHALPCNECECAAAITSGRAWCTLECIANAAPFSGCLPSTTSPFAFTSIKSETRIWLKCTPNGFTQKCSGRSGSRAVMCPVTPSSKPNFENKRNEAASRSLRCRRSSSTLANLGGPGKQGFFTGAVAICTSRKQNSMRTKYSTAPNAEKWNRKGALEKAIIPQSYFCSLALADGILSESLLFVAH